MDETVYIGRNATAPPLGDVIDAVRGAMGLTGANLLGASAIGCLIVLPLTLATDSWVDLFTPWQRPEWALVVSCLLHVVAYTGYIWLVGLAGAVFASQIAYVVTISSVFLSALILSESYSGWVWTALALMVAGLAMVQPRALLAKQRLAETAD